MSKNENTTVETNSMPNSDTNNNNTITNNIQSDKSVRRTEVDNVINVDTNKILANKMSSKIYFITTPKPYKPTQKMDMQPKTTRVQIPNQVEEKTTVSTSTFKIEPKIVVDEGISINFNINKPIENTVSNVRLVTQTTTPSTTTTTSTTTSSTTTTTTTTSTTVPTTTTTESSLFMRVLKDQGPQALGVGVASFAYTALAAMPYWLPFVAGRKKRSISLEKYFNNRNVAKRPIL